MTITQTDATTASAKIAVDDGAVHAPAERHAFRLRVHGCRTGHRQVAPF